MSQGKMRVYESEGVKYPSVTSITGLLNKPFLNFWYGKHGTKACKQIMMDACAIGTATHDTVDNFFNPEGEQTKVIEPSNLLPIKNFYEFNRI